MAIDVAKITASRRPARDEVKKSGTEAQYVHELQLIADALEAIRGELVMLGHTAGTMARTTPK